MNNLTKTEALPKSGHVNEVCKEWIVREDSALAYKLQSQEITDFYKGNRFRNAVVREDFPTALHEQIKEKESAERQAESQRRRRQEQEEHDKRVAKEIADKLERDLQEQQQREFDESEEIAQKMHEIYVNMPPLPPPASRDRSKPPPRPSKASILQQNCIEPSTSSAATAALGSSNSGRQHLSGSANNSNQFHQKSQMQSQPANQSHPLQFQTDREQFVENDAYVGLALHNTTVAVADITTTPLHKKSPNHILVSDEQSSQTSLISHFIERSKNNRHTAISPNSANQSINQHNKQQSPQSTFQYRHEHSSSTTSAGSASSISSATRRNVFDFNHITSSIRTQNTIAPITPHTPISPQLMHQQHSLQFTSIQSPTLIDELVEYSDVADSIRRYDITHSNKSHDATDATPTHMHMSNSTSPSTMLNRYQSPSHENLLRADPKFQKLSPEKYDQLIGNNGASQTPGASLSAAERIMQQHADDIDVYVDPCDYESFKDIGVPLDELKEISKKMKQEQKDELLARRLQQMEASGDALSQLDRDRLMAIEAQDKELARMLQEREKAKARRAKEKARLRKTQQKDSTKDNSSTTSSTSCSLASSLHCGPLLPLPQDCMSTSKYSAPNSPPTTSTAACLQHIPTRDEEIDLEAYSNPFDVLHNSQQRLPNGTLTNGSLTRDYTQTQTSNLIRDEDIYTLPVDSCRPNGHSIQRPASLSLTAENSHILPQHSMTRSETYASERNNLLNGHDMPAHFNYSKSSTFDQSSSPTPPYMPIQGKRRANSHDERKKRDMRCNPQ